ncbi:MAG: hypothetical protein AAFO04_24115 [Cyanobacteria bacterium J06592_8]
MLDWLFGADEASSEPYEVRRNGSEMHIIDQETSEVVKYMGMKYDHYSNPWPQDARNWEIIRNEYYTDEYGRTHKVYGYKYIGD